MAQFLNNVVEGDFTPFLTTTANFNFTHSVQIGKYKKIDNLLFFDVRIVVTTIPAGANPLIISGFPYTFKSQNFISGYLHGVNGSYIPLLFTIPNSNNIELKGVSSTVSVALFTVNGTNILNNVNASIYLSGQAFV